MPLKLFHIDAFTSTAFKGNSACVIIQDTLLDDSLMLKIAAENGVAETAFILDNGKGLVLRWFTPDLEMDLCGHATLASAFVIFNYYPQYIIKDLSGEKVNFSTASGLISVYKTENKLCMHLPIWPAKDAPLPDNIFNSLSIKPKEVYLSRDYLLIYNNAKDIEQITVNKQELDKINLGTGGVIVSAQGDDCDFVSRFFTPCATILEDPVTGSAHCTLVDYWSKKLNKNNLFAKQISMRGGELYCQIKDNKLLLSGEAVCYMVGEILI